MKFVVAPDSFKGTLTANEAAKIMAMSINNVFDDADVVKIPIADGGEGTSNCILSALGGEMIKTCVTYPDFSSGTAEFALTNDKLAVIDMSSAAGIGLTSGKCSVDDATTYGVGELIKAAISREAKKIIVGLGGSGTHDCGCGCAAALGVKFYDGDGKAFVPVGATLGRVRHIDASELIIPNDTEITALCDVENVPFGEDGSAFVFAPQKGADEEMCKLLDRGTRHICEIIKADLNKDVCDLKSGGAAGCMGVGMSAFLGAELRSGIDAILDTVGFDGALDGADIVFTGEGKTDRQTLKGKAVAGVARRAKSRGIPVVAVSGYYDEEEKLTAALKETGVIKIVSITDGRQSIEELKKTAATDLQSKMPEFLKYLKNSKKF